VFEDWLDILQRGTYEVSAPALTVTSDEIGTLKGSGHFSWNADSGIRIQAATDGRDTLTRLSLGGFGMPGRLINHATYLTFAGRTQDNWAIEADAMPRGGYRTHSNLPDVVWDLGTTGLTLRRETTGQTRRVLRILMGPVPPGWTRWTETEVRNEVFGSQLNTRDWLITDCSIGRVAARQRSDEWFEVGVLPHDGEPMCEAVTVCKAVARAFGFVLGRRCVIRGHEEINENKETRRLDTHYTKVTRKTLLQPLGWQGEFLQNVERLLGLAIDFFLTERGERVAEYLFLCWDTADNSHQTQLAMSSICFEGLLRVAAEMLGPTQPQVDSADLTAFQTWLRTAPAGFSPQFLKRLGGLPGTFKNLSANDIFRDWVSRGILGVTRDDSKAWSDTRHPSAHGRLAAAGNRDELQTRVTRHARVQNLLNKILLQLMGYTGVYIDYAQPGYPPAEFPYVTPQEEAAAEEVTPPASPSEPPPPPAEPAPMPDPAPSSSLPEPGSSSG
jgi:hypothetical protein